MTESAFIALHTQVGNNPLNIVGRLHLNVNPVNETDSTGIIQSVIIHVDAHSINGSTEDTSIESVLEQVENIQFTYVGVEYNLNITSSTAYPATHPFYYFTIEPVYITNIFDAEVIGVDNPALISDITLTPYLADLDFGFSDYNPTFSNATEQRLSSILMESDRFEDAVTPSNINALLNETADKASVQDSLYYDSGWTRARYVGTKTNPSDNAGIEPALGGRSFLGEQFSSDTATDYICQSENRLQQEFFHDGGTQLPVYTVSEGPPIPVPAGSPEGTLPLPTPITELTAGLVGGTIYQDTDTTAAGSTNLYHQELVGELIEGDLITPNPNGFYGAEYMRVVSRESPTHTIVERDVFRTRRPVVTNGIDYINYGIGVDIYKLQKYNIYALDKTGQSRLNSVGSSRIYVEGNNSIIETNKTGVLTSQSFCPVFINYVDSPSG